MPGKTFKGLTETMLMEQTEWLQGAGERPRVARHVRGRNGFQCKPVVSGGPPPRFAGAIEKLRVYDAANAV